MSISFSIIEIILTIPLAIFVIVKIYKHYSNLNWESTMKSKAQSYVPPLQHAWKNKRILVIVNPFGGTKHGPFIWKSVVEPMLVKAEIGCRHIVTGHNTHAREIAKNEDLRNISALMVVSGDGMIHMVINGLADRVREQHPDPSTFEKHFAEFFEKVPLAFVPGGSSNGVSSSLGLSDPFVAVKEFIEGSPQYIDLMQVDTYESQPDGSSVKKETKWDVHAFCWGMPVDFDEMTEGPLRFTGPTIKNILGPLFSVISGKRFSGEISFLPQERPKDPAEDALVTNTSGYLDTPKPKVASLDGKWKRIPREDMAILVGMNLAWAADSMFGAPLSDSNGGAIDCIIGRGCSTFQLLNMLVRLESGTHIHLKFIEYIQVKELFLDTKNKQTRVTISGELATLGADQFVVRAHKGIGRVVYPRHMNLAEINKKKKQ